MRVYGAAALTTTNIEVLLLRIPMGNRVVCLKLTANHVQAHDMHADPFGCHIGTIQDTANRTS